MKNSSQEQIVAQPTTESKINRRDMAKLLGAVTALSASLGVTFVASAATVPEGSQLKLKFLKSAPNGDPAKAQLICTIDVSPGDQSKLASTEGPIELRVVGTALQKDNGGRLVAQEVTVSSLTISKTAWHTVKLSGLDKDE